MAQLERDLIRSRIRETMQSSATRGACYGTAPYGFRKVADERGRMTRLEDDPGEKAILGAIRACRERGDTLDLIVGGLRDGDIPTRSGRPWNRRVLGQILARK